MERLNRSFYKQSGKTKYFYHYSTTPYDELKSTNCQNGIPFQSKEHPLKIKDVVYEDNISLFIERPPLDIISGLFNNHPFWKRGNVIYEHLVDKMDLPSTIYYEIVETPDRDAWKKQPEIKELANKDFDKYLDSYYKYLLSVDIFGYTRDKLLDKLKKYYYTTYSAYIESTKKDPNTTKYAEYVTHVMLYPVSGTIPIVKVSEVVLP